MNTHLRLLVLASTALLMVPVVDGPLVGARSAEAQGYGRSSRRDWRDRSRDGDHASSSNSQGDAGNKSSQTTPTSSASSKSSSESKPADSSASASTEKWAKDFVKEHDKNGNKWLDGDEKKDLHGRAAEADANNDGVITVEELVAKLSSNAPAATTSTASMKSSGGKSASSNSGTDSGAPKRVYIGSAGGLASTTKEGDKRHSYRFSTAADRQPKGLPSFFSRDTNGDGQISMSEYSHTWTKSVVSEFRRYDLNDDGIITAKEAAAKPTASGG